MGEPVPFVGPQVWHHPKWIIGFWTILAVCFSLLAASNGSELAPWESALYVVFPPIAAWFLFWRPRLVLTDEHLIVVSSIRTRGIPLALVVDAEPGYYGTDFEMSDGRFVSASVIEKANFSRWLGRTTRSDHVSRLVLDRAARTRGEVPSPAGHHKRSSGDLPSGFFAGLRALFSGWGN